MAVRPVPYLNPEEYLERERAAEYKSEYYNGQAFAMSGASREHNLISNNVAGELRARLKGRPCETYGSDMRVQIRETGAYVYPDVVVVCGEPRFADAHVDTLLNPVVVVEVLSPSTERGDRGEKFAHYRRLESLREYVLISQDQRRVEKFTRRNDSGEWVFTEVSDADGALRLDSLDLELPLAEIYDRVTFAEPSDTASPPTT
ncbi:MAG TPA: Uma2 family endonuclease [Armatimonadaceae bacterium]|nr:Uma2 family endonuclease [Armatimonadaceae bacterium]